jgi:hypothetical protein
MSVYGLIVATGFSLLGVTWSNDHLLVFGTTTISGVLAFWLGKRQDDTPKS